MIGRGKKLGILISAGPDHPGFRHGLSLAETALGRGVDVYLYCIDEAVRGLEDNRLRALRERGLKLYACAYGAQRRHIPLDDKAVFAGLTVVSDLIAATDRFISFN
ncbi:MAG: DsrE family protein [Candidatus Omnitrophica bacterium]|nr:DsrE family protein [Candidatus Omnitrophota bacterium]